MAAFVGCVWYDVQREVGNISGKERGDEAVEGSFNSWCNPAFAVTTRRLSKVGVQWVHASSRHGRIFVRLDLEVEEAVLDLGRLGAWDDGSCRVN